MGSLSLVSTLILTGRFSKTADLTEPAERINITLPVDGQRYVNGEGSNKGNKIIAEDRTLIGSETLDLTSTFNDAFGDSAVFKKLRELAVFNQSVTPGEKLILSGNALTDMLDGTLPTLTVGPSGTQRFASPIDGYTIVNTTQDQLTIDAGVNTITYTLILVGEV